MGFPRIASPSLALACVETPGGVSVVREVPAHDAGFDLIVLALKPQQLASLRTDTFAAHTPRLLVSVLAGVEEATLASLCRPDAIVRAMPNLPVAIGKGVTALYSSSPDESARRTAESLMAPLGQVEWIDSESLFDAVTALSGCGPAFVFRFIDALAKAGAALGLPTDQAARLALATVEGSAAMAAMSDETPATLADRVVSPGGSTREGLNRLDRDGALETLLKETLAASRDRNVVLAAETRG